MSDQAAAEPLIVVGVDGSPQSASVLRWAVREAGVAKGRVRAVLAWHLPQSADDLPFRVESEISEEAEKLLDEVVAKVRGGTQIESVGIDSVEIETVEIETVVQEGSAVRLLLREAKDADMLVIGRHGDGRDGPKLIGGVAATCVLQAPCPVVVVPVEPAPEAV